MSKTIWLVCPAFNEEEVIKSSAEKLNAILEDLINKNKISQDSKILFVDDGSYDNTWELIEEVHGYNERVKGLKLSVNAGQQNAYFAGLMLAKNNADAVITLDIDLQDDINAIETMIDRYYEGFDVVFGVHNVRKKDSFMKKFTAETFYKFMGIIGVDIIENHSEYRLLSKTALERLSHFKESHLFLRGITTKLSDNCSIVEYDRQSRLAGEAKFTFLKSLNLAFDGITSFTIAPIRFVTLIGVIVLLLSLLLYQNTECFSIWFVGGIQIISIGIVGEYASKGYIESKRRPRYFIDKEI